MNLKPMLLMEPDALLRRTVAITARSLAIADVIEAPSSASALQLVRKQPLSGAVIAFDAERAAEDFDFSLIDALHAGPSGHKLPLAVMVNRCDAPLLDAFRARGITRVIIRPFRARTLLDTFADFLRSQPA